MLAITTPIDAPSLVGGTMSATRAIPTSRRCGGQPLNGPGSDQRKVRIGEREQGGRDGHPGHARDQRQPPPDAVGQQAEHRDSGEQRDRIGREQDPDGGR